MERINKLKEFLISSPDDCFVQHALALEYIKIGDDETGKELFEKILSKNPEYVGSYYHLAKLLDRIGETQKAIDIYEKGMEEAKKVNDMHAFGELRSAYEELTF